MKIKRSLIVLIILILSAGGYTALCFFADTSRMLPKTTVNDTDISNMTLTEASDALKKEAAIRSKDSVFTVSYNGTDYALSAGAALELDYDATAKKVLKKSQTDFFARGITWIRAHLSGNPNPHPVIKEDPEAFHNALKDSGLLDAVLDDQETYKITDDQLLITAGSLKKVDEEKLISDLIPAIQAKEYWRVTECPLTSDEAWNTDTYWENIYKEIHTDAVNAPLDPAQDYKLVESVTGVDFDIENAKKALSKAADGETIAIDLIYTEPEITTQDLKEHLFADTLGTYTTKVSGTSNRLTNVRLASEKCNNAILLAGDTFSFNKAVGEQTAATGFKTADAILDGEIIQAYGGGICQVSSTIFAASLYANLDIEEWWNHDYVSSYIGAGLDSAVAWDALDLLIGNPSPYPMKIVVDYSGDNLTVTVLGTRTDDSLIEVQTETLESSSEELLEVVTYRNVYTEDKSQMFHEKIGVSSYIK